MRSSIAGTVLPALFAIAVAGCGGDDDVSTVNTPVPSATSTVAAPATSTATHAPGTATVTVAVPTATLTPTTTFREGASPTITFQAGTATPTGGEGGPTLTATATAATPSNNPVLNLPVDQAIELPALSEFSTTSVDVAYDELGIPHIYGNEQTGVLFVQGYLTASERFWQMDIFRRFAEGRLAEIFGPTAAAQDIGMRTMFTTRDGRRLEEALWQRLSAEDTEGAQSTLAFTAGVNAWLADLKAARNGAQLPPEYTFPVLGITANQLADWRPQDTVAIGRLQALSLSDSSGDDIGLARILASLPEDLADDIYRSAPAAPATVLPVAATLRGATASPRRARNATTALPSLTLLDEIQENLRRLHDANPIGTRDRGVGSNNWIISPALSESGFATMANDPHLALFNPPIWYMVQLDGDGETIDPGESQRVNGVNFPGLPGVILGHNDYGAWGATVSGFDVTDVYIETVTTPDDYPASPRTVLFKGEQVPVIRLEETVNVRGFPSRTAIIEVVPHHGPMLADPNLDDDVVGLAATGMTVRWTGQEVTLDSRFLLDLNRARNVTEFRDSLRNFAVGGQNWVWADIEGNIAYFPYVFVPQRPAGSIPFLPMPGTGDNEWLADEQGNPIWLPAEKFPQALNPAEGFLSSANNDQNGNTLDNDPLNDETYFAYSYDLGFREQRIHELLSNAAGLRDEGGLISVSDVSRYQFDHQSKEAERLLPFLFAAAANRPDLLTPAMSDALARLQQWGIAKPGTAPGDVAFDMVAGIDAAALRTDVPPRAVPVSDEEKDDAAAASIYVGWVTRLGRLTFADDFQGTGIGTPGGQDATKALLHLLEDVDRDEPGFVVHTKGDDGESTLWDNRNTAAVETRDEILLSALDAGLTFMQSRFPNKPVDDWAWGRLHQVRFENFLAQGGFSSFDLAPFAAFGGRFTVNPGDFSLNSDSFNFSGGPSMRLVVTLDPSGVRAVNTLPGGNNGNPGSIAAFNTINPAKHYGDHVPEWLNGETFALHISREEVAAATERHLRFTP